MFGILEAVAIPRTGVFDTYDNLVDNLNERMVKDGYKIVKSRSHRARVVGPDGPSMEMIRADLVCDRGGRPYKSVATERKTSTKKTGCPWKAKAVKRKTVGGWVLTMVCDEHNHEPGTPEPPSPEPSDDEAEQTDDSAANLPALGPETAAAVQVAGLSDTAVRLTGETFNQYKRDYRKLSPPERMQILANMQMRIAAIFAIQNEDAQRQRRLERQEKRHQEIEASKRARQGENPTPISTNKRQRLSNIGNPNLGQGAPQHQMQEQAQQSRQQLTDTAQPQDKSVQTSVTISNRNVPFQQYAFNGRRGRAPNP
ncbi:hypothetical protein CCM_06846 [Cordyceps militaris CM01]|uniref:FAR1 domain-containing protein n=2 Tax=Cordyceps militaris TaxID=73501 RepID=G3JL52_CORMM|nr:uncharacterized protein CCM_06846 [Cordyceps militaris CM01]ATY63607.1 WD domain-containing [Cordyceps militaris]EGX90426.1 hypothetical protein CCM_06846 [Cordyceps militaris CM01]